MNYSEAVAFLYQQLPMYQQIGKVAYKKDLTNVRALLQALGNPHECFRSVHIAGTNGKGSCAHSLAAVLQSANYHTGLYTSPHLKSFTERIRIDGKDLMEETVVDFVQRHGTLIKTVQPSFFELTVAMAFEVFARQEVDIAVIEVGLGGRLDSTNIIRPEVCLITNIGYDHTDMLGNTLSEIAREKAGVIKPEVPVVIGQRHSETMGVFKEVAHDQRASLHFAEDYYRVAAADAVAGGLQLSIQNQRSNESVALFFSLGGQYQVHNIPGILATLDRLQERGWILPAEAIAEGLAHIPALTGLKGRWQIIHHNPLCIADTGHNAEAWQAIMQQLRSYAAPRYHFVLGLSQGKDVDSLLNSLPQDGIYYFCQANVARALPANALAIEAKRFSLKGQVFERVQQAYACAHREADHDDVIFVGGSSFVVAELDDI